MRLDGWNHIPRGYGLAWDRRRAPRWLRIWCAAPIVDRYAYPVLVRRRIAWLVPHPGWRDEDRDDVAPGWEVADPAVHARMTELAPPPTATLRRWPWTRRWWRS